MPRWIEFHLAPPLNSRRKTDRWRVINKKGRFELGEVRWYAPWRGYCFSPNGWGLIFESECLRDIATFCEERTASRARREESKK